MNQAVIEQQPMSEAARAVTGIDLRRSWREVRSGIAKLVVHHPRRLAVLVGLISLNVLMPVRLLGFLNRRYSFIHSLFLGYPASDRFAKHFGFEFMIRKLKWRTAIYGVFVQGGKLGLLMLTSTTERQFTRRENSAKLARLREDMERMQTLVGAKELRFAGVLPHYIARGTSSAPAAETSDRIAELLVDAYVRVCSALGTSVVPAILLGGRGAIGTRLAARLVGRGVPVHIVDKKAPRECGEGWPDHLHGQVAVVIDVARKGARAEYAGRFWKELCYLNETYPEPHGESLQQMKKLGMRVWHVVGVRGHAFPPFPYAYRGGVPCCAMHTNHAEVLIRELG